MFKRASDNSQFRAINRVLNSSMNEAGIDPDAFYSDVAHLHDQEYESLKAQKHQLQVLKANIRTQISLACAQKRATGKMLCLETWSHLQQTNLDISCRMAEIDKKICQTKQEIKKLNNRNEREGRFESQSNFEFVFFSMAKEMLSDPVFNRITTATLHRLSQMNEGGDHE